MIEEKRIYENKIIYTCSEDSVARKGTVYNEFLIYCETVNALDNKTSIEINTVRPLNHFSKNILLKLEINDVVIVDNCMATQEIVDETGELITYKKESGSIDYISIYSKEDKVVVTLSFRDRTKI